MYEDNIRSATIMDNNFNFDMPYTFGSLSSFQKQIEENERQTRIVAQEAYNNRQKMQKALEMTASNTGKTNEQLAKIIQNQSEYIDMLKKQLEIDEQQLSILKDIFTSEEDGVAVEKEIWKLIQEQIDESHPLWEYVKDKGGDVAVAGITAGIPILYNAFKAYMLKIGIILP